MKSFKASELFRKTYFQIKVNKSGSVIISDLGESRGNRSSWGSFFCMLFPYFVYIAHFTKFTRGRSFLMKKNQKRKKVFGKKKKKENEKTGLKPKAQGWTLHFRTPDPRSEKSQRKMTGRPQIQCRIQAHILENYFEFVNTSGDEFDRPIETIASWSIRPEGTRGSKSIYW